MTNADKITAVLDSLRDVDRAALTPVQVAKLDQAEVLLVLIEQDMAGYRDAELHEHAKALGLAA